MRRRDLEHIIRAASTISDDEEIVVLGSQAVLAQYPEAPEEMRVSDEADVYPRNKPERWELIDGAIGELSPFHETFGYYAQGVQEGVATLPMGWQERLVKLQTPGTMGAIGWCLELHDLVLSKYVANRGTDKRYNEAAARAGLVNREELISRLGAMDLDESVRRNVLLLIEKDFSTA
ncbi:MAG: DUF6036 family nucleotidyltransferase [Polyangiaceae bacterium]|nr:DUF6036 family nucleotidyltransferase [Polyangiaceae bacterium]